MLLLALRFGTDKQVKAAAPRRPHVRIPKLMRYELRANIYQARDLQAADDNGLADPYVKVSLADPHPHPHPPPHLTLTLTLTLTRTSRSPWRGRATRRR